MHSGLMAENSSMIQRWSSTWDAPAVILDKSISNLLDAPSSLDSGVSLAKKNRTTIFQLTHVPTGRDALLILAFLKDQDYDIRLSEERTALTEQTIEAKNIVAAFDPKGNIMMSNNWIMKKSLGHEDIEMYTSMIQEFADAFFKYVNNDQRNREKSRKRYIHRDQEATALHRSGRN